MSQNNPRPLRYQPKGHEGKCFGTDQRLLRELMYHSL